MVSFFFRFFSLVDESHRKEQHIERRELRQKRRERKLIKLQRDLHMQQKKAERQQKQQKQQNNRSTIRSYDDNNLESSTSSLVNNDSKRSKLRRIKSTSILNKSSAMSTTQTTITSTQPVSSVAMNSNTLRQNKQVPQKQSIGSKGIRLWNRKRTSTSSISVSFHDNYDKKSSFPGIAENNKSKPTDAKKSTASLASLGITNPIVSPKKSMSRSLSSPLINSSHVKRKSTYYGRYMDSP